jgi:hypothetical protein
LPFHHNSEEYLDAYLHDSGIADQKATPLGRSMNKERELSEIRMSRQDVFRMIKGTVMRLSLAPLPTAIPSVRPGLRPIC